MPFATFTKIREVSSEDDHNLAENLIKPQQGKKWKTKNVGEKSAYIILEMQEAEQIIGIDVGNEHSAFVEVLVGKSTCSPNDFTEILITCSFMTPIESKSSNNANRVRCFNKDALVPTAAEKKWSLIKVICTQPFNKHVQYGLSFIKIHVAQAKTTQIAKILAPQCPIPDKGTVLSKNESNMNVPHIGKFKLREDSPDSESDGVSSSLFNRWKKTKDNTGQTTAASIRVASKNIALHTSRNAIEKPNTSLSNAKTIEILDRNRDVLLFSEADDAVLSERELRLAKEIEVDKERRRLEIQKQSERNKTKDKRKSIDSTQQRKNNDKDNTAATSKIENTIGDSTITANTKQHAVSPNIPNAKNPNDSRVKIRPFNQLLRGVVLVISGIQNPDRGDLRNKALALGAKYKGDWDSTCTHLICAFKNTPKYSQVRGKGKIVTRAWIEKCYHSKKYLPWRRFALDSQELGKSESDEEILDESLQPRCTDNKVSNPSTSRRESADRNDTLSLYELDVLQPKAVKRKKMVSSSSGSDTDDEIQRIERKNLKPNTEEQHSNEEKYRPCEGIPCLSRKKSEDIYEASTDEEDYLQSKQNQAHCWISTK